LFKDQLVATVFKLRTISSGVDPHPEQNFRK
jgi:hypothetical protein